MLLKTIKILLTISILLTSNNLFSQFDSLQVKKIRIIIEDNKFLNLYNDSLISNINYLKLKTLTLESDCKQRDSVNQIIIGNKNKEIQELNKTPFTTYLLLITTSISVGIITGMLVK